MRIEVQNEYGENGWNKNTSINSGNKSESCPYGFISSYVRDGYLGI